MKRRTFLASALAATTLGAPSLGVLERQARLRRRMHQAKDIPVVRKNRASIRVPIVIARSAGQSLQQRSG